jgi:hypothetical protein
VTIMSSSRPVAIAIGYSGSQINLLMRSPKRDDQSLARNRL